MAWKIPDATIQEIRDRVSIVEVVSSYVSLKRAGRNHLGLCPFHAEKTPSFTVNEERALFHCFGCGAGGTVFTFVMRMERVEFPEAVELVARRAGVALPPREPSTPGMVRRDRLMRINSWAAKKFTAALWGAGGEPGRRYLEARGVSKDIANTYGLGYAPAAGTLLAGQLGGRREALDVAVEVGLIARREQGGHFDRFRGRLMFPITDVGGKVLGFGGRALDDAQPKYLNSPESALFHKGKILFGLPQARAAARADDRVVVVEGYLDALALVQYGLRGVVATLGTAVTADHLRALRRVASQIVLFFDGDAAGRAAAVRSFATAAEVDVATSGAFLPSGEDPDSFVRGHGAPAVRELLDAAIPIADFYFQEKKPALGASVAARTRAAAEAAQVLALVSNPLRRDALIGAAAQQFGLGEEAMREACAQVRGPRQPLRPVSQPAAALPPPAAELFLVETMARDHAVAEWVEARGVLHCFRDAELAACARQLATAWAEGGGAVARALEQLPEALTARLTSALVGPDAATAEERLQLARDCAIRIEADARRPVLDAARVALRQAASAGDEDRERELLRRVQEQLRQRQGEGA